MIGIKVNVKIVILSILIALIMYPKTIALLISMGENLNTARRLSTAAEKEGKFTAGTNKTRVVFIFDDGWESVYLKAYGIMNKYDYTASISVIPLLVGKKEYMSYEQLSQLQLKGWELLNHSYSHEENKYDNPDRLLADFNKAREWMKNRYMGRCSNMLIIPYGEINPYLINRLKAAGYDSARTSDNIIILNKNEIEYYPVTTVNLLTNVSADEVKEILAQAFSEPKTILFVLHKIGEVDDGSGMTYSEYRFAEIIKFINEHDDELEIVNYSQLFE